MRDTVKDKAILEGGIFMPCSDGEVKLLLELTCKANCIRKTLHRHLFKVPILDFPLGILNSMKQKAVTSS